MNTMYYDLIKIGGYTIKSVKMADRKYPTSKHGIAYISRLENNHGFFDILYDIHTKEIVQVWFQKNIKNHGAYVYINPDYADVVENCKSEVWVGRVQPIMISNSPVAKNATYEKDFHKFMEKLKKEMKYNSGQEPVRIIYGTNGQEQ